LIIMMTTKANRKGRPTLGEEELKKR
jgi:hypothetical protein